MDVKQRTLAHHAVDRERELALDLIGRQLRRRAVAAALVREQRVGVADRALAALDRDIHQATSVERGRAATRAPAQRIEIDAERKRRAIGGALGEKIVGQRAAAPSSRGALIPGPESRSLGPPSSARS